MTDTPRNAEIEARLLPHLVTIRKPVQSFVPGTRKPVFEYQVIATGIPARFNPESTTLQRTVLGESAKKRYQLFLNVIELLENYEILREDTNEVFVVTEVKNLFGHHLEVTVSDKAAS